MDTDQTEVVQPEEEGQGDGGQGGDSPYADYLNRIPEEVRGEVEPVFRDWDANVTRMRQEDAERRGTWEPYEQLGVQNVPADEVQWLMQFRDALGNPEVIRNWYEETYAPANGLTPAQAEQQQQAQPQVDDFFASDEDRIAKLVEERLNPFQQRLDEIDQQRQQQEQERQLAEREQYYEGQLAKLAAEHGDEFNGEVVAKLAMTYVQDDPQNAVQRGFDEWRGIRAQIERATLQGKASQPPPAESGGVAAAAPEEIRTLEQAREVARQMLHQANQS